MLVAAMVLLACLEPFLLRIIENNAAALCLQSVSNKMC